MSPLRQASRYDSHDISERQEYATAIAKSQPAWDKMTAHADTGTPYPISERELTVLQDPASGPDHPGWRPFPTRISLAQAHAMLKSAHIGRPTWAQYAARKRLLDAQTSSHGTRSPGLVIKMVNDIDTILFDGLLRNRILVHWIDHSVYTRRMRAAFSKDEKKSNAFERITRSLATTIIPPARFRDSVRPAIYISAEAICFASQSRVDLIALLVHEMLHAYLAVVSGDEDEGVPERSMDGEEVGSAAVGHGPMFEASCELLAARLGFKRMSGRDLYRYHEQPKMLVQLKEPEKRVKVRLQDGLMHYVLPSKR
ncbi:hypothetical protein LTR17_023434 [Elasticomyces elasticus]|nr:hypothetical protein LTR17_023434 [Elasticomyces elasticus]